MELLMRWLGRLLFKRAMNGSSVDQEKRASQKFWADMEKHSRERTDLPR